MALNVTLENNGLGVVFTYSDVLEGDAAVAASETLYTPEVLQRLHYQIADLRAVNRVELTTRQIQRLADTDRQAAQRGNGFLVVSIVNHDIQESISRFYRTYVQDPQIESAIFKSIPAARQWLKKKLQQRGIDLAAATELTTPPTSELEFPTQLMAN